MNSITITVYLQALGGKFLGPNAFSTADEPIAVSFICGSIDVNLPYAASSSDDGNIDSCFSNSIPYTLPILTLDSNTYTENFLTTGSNTIAGTVTVPASAVTPFMNAAIIAVIPRPTGIPLKIVQNVVLTTGQPDYTFTMPVPGLLLEPGTDTQPADTISVLVKMMCGCKVTVNTTKSFWAPDDFEVMAYLSYSDGSVISYPMRFDTVSNDSTFIAVVNDNSYTEIYFTAQQRSTGNYGYLNIQPS